MTKGDAGSPMIIIKMIKTWYSLLLSIFFARQCACCRQIAEEGLFCSDCRCALSQPLWLTGYEVLAGIAVMFRYDGVLKKTLQKIKFVGQKNLLQLLAVECNAASSCLPEAFTKILRTENIIFVPVPTVKERVLARGFDLPLLLFAHWGLQYPWQELLVRKRATVPQYGLNPYERKLNLEGCFAVRGNVAGATVVLVDDIFTTGATMEEAARTLKYAGAAQVYGLVLCGSIENYGQINKKNLQA